MDLNVQLCKLESFIVKRKIENNLTYTIWSQCVNRLKFVKTNSNFFYLLKGSNLVDYKGSSIEKVESQINLAHDGL